MKKWLFPFSPVGSVGASAFAEVPIGYTSLTGLTISDKSGSYAETYTKENNVPFMAV
ncbi:MAG: hypothetical protein VZR73_09550 [Acutalibacteraceae bacterium]|nr:hypothetical protein [Clostridia bacterium]MEE3404316.1 hypothetical protein [Acutalibacteraceae bacterium]